VPVTGAPLSWIVHAVSAVLEVPVLLTFSVHTSFPLTVVHEATAAETRAELVNDPKRPNTNPAMAMAAMRVMAIRITVANTGEIAFLFLEGVILKGIYLLVYSGEWNLGTVGHFKGSTECFARCRTWACSGAKGCQRESC